MRTRSEYRIGRRRANGSQKASAVYYWKYSGKAAIKHFSNLEDAQDSLVSQPVDVMFLDLNLHGKDGFLLLHEQLVQPFHTIVVSANTDRALEAFELGVLDFVGKPFTQERIDKALQRFADANVKVNAKPCHTKNKTWYIFLKSITFNLYKQLGTTVK